MNPLAISITGTVNASNFTQWKTDLLFEIQSTNYELLSDNDFVAATAQVKLFKSAQATLKQAKQAAISQAEEINRLFAAIDEIAEQARQARLSLERQIKTRKQQIKDQHIQSGIDQLEQFIHAQGDELASLDLSAHLDRVRFESAVRGKSGIKGVETAIRRVCTEIEQEITDRVANLSRNRATLDALPDAHKLLFQDGKLLADLPARQLALEVEKRIATYNEDSARRQTEQLQQVLSSVEELDLNPEQQAATEGAPAPQESYLISIDLRSSKDVAKQLAHTIKSAYSDHPAVTAIRLTRNRQQHAD